MNSTRLTLTAPLLDAETESALARTIEAGLYAEWLLANDDQRYAEASLHEVARAGREAWQQIYASNLKLVMKLSLAVAYRYRLPLDDLFQEGCLALGEALRRFDFARGVRLATFAHDWISRCLTRAANTRCGSLDLLRQADGERIPVAWVGLDHAPLDRVTCEADYESVERESLDFLELLGEDGVILKLRFGIDTTRRSRSRVAAQVGVSATTIKRVEERALERARRLLSAERCRVPVVI